jgi:tRNA(Ile)-lysidine synthase
MTGLRFGYGTNGFANHRLADALAVVAGLGYQGVALTLDHDHLDPFAPGLAARVARTADQLRDDVEALDALAEAAYQRVVDEAGVLLEPLHDEHPAIASRVLRAAAVRAGAVDSELFHVHVRALADLASGRVRGEVRLPGHVTAIRDGGRLRFDRRG